MTTPAPPPGPVTIDPGVLQQIIDQAVAKAVADATAGITSEVDTAVTQAEVPVAQTPSEVLCGMLGLSATPNELANIGQWLAQYGLEDTGSALTAAPTSSPAAASSPAAGDTTGVSATPGA
jgi:hypothetical protein